MKKFGFVATLFLSGVISTSALAQNYYDPGFYQNNNYGYANYNNASNTYYQNNAYYSQPQAQPNNYQPQPKTVPNQTRPSVQRRGVGTVSMGLDYVMGFSKFVSKEHNFGEIFTGSNDYIFDTNEFDKQSKSFSVNIGWRPFKHLGIEAYYLSSFKSEKTEDILSASDGSLILAEQDISYKSYGIDIIGYYPINDFIEFLASVGVGKYDVEGNVVISGQNIDPSLGFTPKSQTFEDSVVAYRIGGGLQFWLSRHMAFRVTGRWTSFGGDFADYITEVNLGVRYHF